MRLATYSERGTGATHLGLVLGDRSSTRGAAKALGLPACPTTCSLHRAGRGGARHRARDRRSSPATRAGPAARRRAPARADPAAARNVVCVGLNYADHVAESKSVVGADVPKFPVFFTKPPSTVIGPDDEIPWHGHVSTAIDWEVELAVIIGREGRDIGEAAALEYVFGYTVANDVTARDLQQRHGQWYKGKGLDGFCPLGPVVVTADEIGDPHALDIGLRVNGVEKQRSNTAT